MRIQFLAAIQARLSDNEPSNHCDKWEIAEAEETFHDFEERFIKETMKVLSSRDDNRFVNIVIRRTFIYDFFSH